MIAATVDGTLCWLLGEDPDWNSAMPVDFASQTTRDLGLTQRESRVRLASATEASFSWRATVTDVGAALLDQQIRTYDNRPVLAPFWLEITPLSAIATSHWGDGLRLFFEPDLSHWQIRAGAQAPTSFEPTVNCLTVPLAWCRFAKLPTVRLAKPDTHLVDFSVVETGLAAYAIAPRPLVLATGPIAGGSARPVLPIAPDWSESPQQTIDVRIARKKLGRARGEAEEYYPHTPLGLVTSGFTFRAGDAARVVELFRQCGGMARPWWSPSWTEYTYLAADSSAASAQIVVESAASLAGAAAIALASPGGEIAVRGVVSIAGNTVTLDASPGEFPIGTAVSPAQLCRFKADKLSLKFANPELATVTIDTVTLPTEGADILGYEGACAALYRITDGAAVWRYTDHDVPIDAGALGVFTPIHIEPGRIVEEINLEEHGSSLELRHFAANPFARLVDESDHGELTVTIYRVDPEVPGSAKALFTAKAKAPKASGPIMTVQLTGFNALFDTKGPRQLMQDTCCASFGDEKCKLPNPGAEYEVAAVAGSTVDFVLPDPAPEPVFFVCGVAERATPAGGVQRWPIRSAAIASGVLRLQLGGSITPAPEVGDTWMLFRGCPGTKPACIARDNLVNMRAFTEIPTRNPSVTPVTSVTSGKK